MWPVLGILAASLLMAVSNIFDSNAIFMLSSVLLLIFGFLYLQK